MGPLWRNNVGQILLIILYWRNMLQWHCIDRPIQCVGRRTSFFRVYPTVSERAWLHDRTSEIERFWVSQCQAQKHLSRNLLVLGCQYSTRTTIECTCILVRFVGRSSAHLVPLHRLYTRYFWFITSCNETLWRNEIRWCEGMGTDFEASNVIGLFRWLAVNRALCDPVIMP